jgi:hypothetical protein
LVVNPSLYVYQISSKNGPSALTWHFWGRGFDSRSNPFLMW